MTSDLLKQWAADMTHSGPMMAPPQAGIEANLNETCQGHECAQASWPPMILDSISCSGTKDRMPDRSTDRILHILIWSLFKDTKTFYYNI